MLSHKFQSLLRQGQAFQAKGHLKEAAELYAQLRAGAPTAYEGWHYGGMTALLLGQADVAEQWLAQSLRLNPAFTQTALGLGVARVAKGDAAGAETALRSVVERQPKLADAWHYLALAIETQGRYADAVAARQRVVSLNPKHVPGWTDLGSTLSRVGKLTEALASFSKAYALDPKNLRARLGRGMTLYKCHRVSEAVEDFGAVLASDPRQFQARSFRLVALNNLPDVSQEQVFEEHCAFGKLAGEPVNSVWPNSPDPARRLRVAFLSPDLRDHSVAYFLEPLLQRLDQTQFEILLYADHPLVDHVTARLRSHASVWRNFAEQVSTMVEATITRDAPDVLVDLAGHSGTNRLEMLARRVAPVQITYLGYPNTTGVPAMDYRLVDAWTDPERDADRFATETLVRFAPTAWTYLPPASAPEVGPLPSLANEFITFGSFNNFPKVTDALLRRWAQILNAVPAAHLLIKADGLGEPAVREPVEARLRAAGLAEDRVTVLPRTPDTASHLALYNRVDIALETFPYNGTTTTCEALWMGVPVIGCTGDRHAARVGISLLTAVGHPEWIGNSEEDYVRLAIDLAVDRERLAAYRGALRDEMRRSALLDHAAQAERFGAAVRACWMRWCERQRGATHG
jgi:predicted O-linked N-acetylglucosamine transferase (SPINDLY family)